MSLPDSLKNEIIESLKPLEPEKIILFGSYAWGEPTNESDIDLFVIKEVPESSVRELRLQARRQLRAFQYKHHVGLDILADSMDRVNMRIIRIKDQFYEEIVTRGEVIYAK